MGEHVKSAVVETVVGAAASYLTSKYEELTGGPDKIQRLEWKALKIQGAIEESKKYDIENEALQKMLQKLIDTEQEIDKILEEFRNFSSETDSQCLDQDVALQIPLIAQSPSSGESERRARLIRYLDAIICRATIIFKVPVADFFSKMRKIEKLDRILESAERISGDISDFLEMLRHQKRKRDRRRRYRPYKSFFKLAYLELVHDVLGYCWAQVLWMH